MVQVSRKRLEAFAIKRSVQQGCPLFLFLYVLALEPQLRRLRDKKASPDLRGIPFASPLSAKISAYADDIIVFVFCHLDIKAVKKAVARYEQIAGAKINFDKSEGLQQGAGRGSVHLPEVAFLLEWWTRLHPRGVVRARVPTGAKLVGSTGPSGYLASKALVVYWLSIFPQPRNHRLALQRSLSKLHWGGGRPMVRRQVCWQCPGNGGLGMTDMENHWIAERLAYLSRSLSTDAVWRRKVSDTFPKGWRST